MSNYKILDDTHKTAEAKGFNLIFMNALSKMPNIFTSADIKNQIYNTNNTLGSIVGRDNSFPAFISHLPKLGYTRLGKIKVANRGVRNAAHNYYVWCKDIDLLTDEEIVKFAPRELIEDNCDVKSTANNIRKDERWNNL